MSFGNLRFCFKLTKSKTICHKLRSSNHKAKQEQEVIRICQEIHLLWKRLNFMPHTELEMAVLNTSETNQVDHSFNPIHQILSVLRSRLKMDEERLRVLVDRVTDLRRKIHLLYNLLEIPTNLREVSDGDNDKDMSAAKWEKVTFFYQNILTN